MNEGASLSEAVLEQDEIALLVEELEIDLPDIPVQSEELFYEVLLREYEESLDSMVETINQFLEIAQNLVSSPILRSLILSPILLFLDKHQDEILDNLIQQRKKDLLKKAIAFSELEVSNLTDPLTKLWSKAAYGKFLQSKYDWIKKSEPHWEKEGNPRKIVLLCMIDLDDFKEVNDTHGHLVGDEFLKQIATTLNDAIKQETDLAFRFGGDEFALLLQIDEEDLMTYGDTIEEAISNFAQVIHDRISNKTLTIKVNGNAYAVDSSVSMGVSRLDPNQKLEQIEGSTDLKLYDAKEMGKNHCVA
jgi:diguanylate cyclase (GGDEF)-like protein